MEKTFCIVETAPGAFDFYCCYDCARFALGDSPDIELMSGPGQAKERTGRDAIGVACFQCNWSVTDWTPLKVRGCLRGLGYQASLANGFAFDINIRGRIHYLSSKEAIELAEANLPHPVDLSDYITEQNSRNSWYSFKEESDAKT